MSSSNNPLTLPTQAPRRTKALNIRLSEQEREAVEKSTRTQLANFLSEQQLKKYDVLSEHPQMRRRPGRDGEREKKE